MGRFKEFSQFCKSNRLDPEKSPTLDFFRRDQLGLPWGEERGGSCPKCGKECIKTNGERWHCFYCGEGGVIDEAVPLTLEQVAAERDLRKEDQERNRKRALEIWDDGVPINSSNATVATYFRARGLSLEPIPDLDSVMRWHPACPFGPRNKVPCIVSLFRDMKNDEPTAIHRTWITSASRGRSERKALGPFYGSAIKLWPLTSDHETLTVGEGIENVLAAVALKVGATPAWAATVAGNLSRLPVLRGVRRLTIAADNDDHGKGQEHAKILRRKWRDEGREVLAKIPPEIGKDFNDVLREGGA